MCTQGFRLCVRKDFDYVYVRISVMFVCLRLKRALGLI